MKESQYYDLPNVDCYRMWVIKHVMQFDLDDARRLCKFAESIKRVPWPKYDACERKETTDNVTTNADADTAI